MRCPDPRRVVQGGTRATLEAAKKLEQQLINQYGGKNGGQLLNKINSIAEKYWKELGISPP
jgi:hypothetical protein